MNKSIPGANHGTWVFLTRSLRTSRAIVGLSGVALQSKAAPRKTFLRILSRQQPYTKQSLKEWIGYLNKQTNNWPVPLIFNF